MSNSPLLSKEGPTNSLIEITVPKKELHNSMDVARLEALFSEHILKEGPTYTVIRIFEIQLEHHRTKALRF